MMIWKEFIRLQEPFETHLELEVLLGNLPACRYIEQIEAWLNRPG